MIFCSVENGIISIGFRKITSFVRTIFPDIEVCHVTPSNLYSRIDAFVNFGNTKNDMSNNDIKAVASYLAKADMICFSSMTPFADLTKKLLKNIHEINKNIFTVWGGIHQAYILKMQ